MPKGPAGEDSALPSTTIVAPKAVATKGNKKGAKVKDETVTPRKRHAKGQRDKV